MPAQSDLPTVHAPEAGQQVAEGDLAAGRPDDGGDGPLGNVQRDAVNDGFFAIREANVLCMKVAALRVELRTGNVHGGQIQDSVGLIHAGVRHPQQAGLCTGLVPAPR